MLQQAGRCGGREAHATHFQSGVIQQAKTWCRANVSSGEMLYSGRDHHFTHTHKKKNISETLSCIQNPLMLFFFPPLCSWLRSGPDRWDEASRVAQSRGDCDNWPRCWYHWVPRPLTSKSQRPRFQFNTGLDQISLIAGLRHIFDTFTLEAQLSAD